LSGAASFDTVPPDMPSSRPNRRRRVERREVRAARRTRRFALLILLAIVLVIALLVTAFGGGASLSGVALCAWIKVAADASPTERANDETHRALHHHPCPADQHRG